MIKIYSCILYYFILENLLNLWYNNNINNKGVFAIKISTKGRYALRMMIDLAIHQEEGYISLKDVAERQKISKKYLEQIVPLMNQSGLLRTNRGNRGGYMLAVKPEQCTVGDILRATEGSLAPVSCLDYEPNECPRVDECSTIYVWKELYKRVTDYLDSVTIKEIADKSIMSGGGDYCI